MLDYIMSCYVGLSLIKSLMNKMEQQIDKYQGIHDSMIYSPSRY